MSKPPSRQRSNRAPREKKEFDQQVIDIARVTRVMAGGKRMRFRACIVIGDRKGRVGMGLAKGADVSGAITKAVAKAKKHLMNVTIVNETIPHVVEEKFGAAKVLLKPAPQGSGIIAGGAVRSLFELAGIRNIVGKMLGSQNKVNNIQAALGALAKLRDIESIRRIRAIS
ncbi:MAG: 30S ribosomal protein S5 [Candidatus Kerfeldbacteria bacterium RIFCSPLOWO2_01_FULL_48_11]|uniref:Small ribosomal subunit protein uS5 n=1 Tax=Candidatus Kerfeldbacteria bacterium RIFCSPLOWO2_01_FULL_48_11 TaxID=1798543 RepID=A0A1G2B5X8_9BACT|nr:MAG: 30S ribosomal protein S5 [Parcubacteria group bacterium GW2011_GWA2_48_9]KKW15809.1 MAG: 30S ribosomal protein S5 [Parcubacteria group bacterium GW2011_GWC2_49_9]OGY84385.1 MAG: 30S ribosomal protein S5 [Candidatus Kerfeldbacteria bacterium RIFCSPLOWO2_01_FULL_48_11]HCJ52205.1 30S ribosomal protein S5 [Candidatus Kerfeldbacteria bacterium]HCM68510.1 30S ribosomal protein S5 [Candidatus Kerfeldbacteria bacterium]